MNTLLCMEKKFSFKILRWGNDPGGPNLITSFLIRGSQEGQSQRKSCEDGSRGKTDPAISQGTQAASKSWKTQRTVLPRDSGEDAALLITLSGLVQICPLPNYKGICIGSLLVT